MENFPILFCDNGKYSYICIVKQIRSSMKSSEFHRFVQINGWREVRQAGSHIIYEKAGRQITVPYHGSKEMKKGLVLKIKKEMGL